MKKFRMLAACICCCLCGYAQTDVPFLGKISWLGGYARDINGETIGYTSAYPHYANSALLVRCTDGNKSVEWETEAVPAQMSGKYLYFSWLASHSSGSSSGVRDFDLYINNEKILTFSTQPANKQPLWSFAAPDSTRLVFVQLRQDGARDAHGQAFLRVPAGKYAAGKPLRIKVTGHAQQSNDWYMTFRFDGKERVDVSPVAFLLKNGQRPMAITALHFGGPQPLHVRVGGQAYSFTIEHGFNRFEVPVTVTGKSDSIRVQADAGNALKIDRYVVMPPVTHRTIWLIHHAHTDIGYSHIQPEVVKIHNKNIDDALEQIERTKHFSPEARFKWNVESLWAVENYLSQASPSQKEKFIRAVKAGGICLSALYANILTGLSEPEELFHYTDYAARLRKQYGFDINSAMISDVPGYTWATVTAMAHGGVKYFSSGANESDRIGHFLKEMGDRPCWWVSPSGQDSVLFWAAGKGYSNWHGWQYIKAGNNSQNAAQKIDAYMQELDEKNYPYEMVQWRFNVRSDNAPIDTTVADFVEKWNEKYSTPKLVLGTTVDMFREFEKRYGKDIPVIKGDITPYWEDGAVSTAREEGQNRINALRLQQLGTLYAMLSPAKYNADRFYQAWRNVVMFSEHTWGAHNSISAPDIPFVTEQWRIKKAFMEEGDSITNVLEKDLLQPLQDETSGKIAVINTLSYTRSGPVYFRSSVKGSSITDGKGKAWPLQRLSDGRYVFFAKDIPPFSSALYKITSTPVRNVNSIAMPNDTTLENSHIIVSWNPRTGDISRLATQSESNLAGQFNGQGLNSYWYVPGRDPKEAQTATGLTTAIVEKGPVMTSIVFKGTAPGTNGLEKKITLFADAATVDIENVVDKKAVRTKESVHFGFPFSVKDPAVYMDAGYGTMRYPADQLPGSNEEFISSRRWMDVANEKEGVQLFFKQTPMLEPNAMIDENTPKIWKHSDHPYSTATWFSYAMNNYWHTNYKSDQAGEAAFSYSLRPHGAFSYTDAEQYAAAYTQPLTGIALRNGIQLPAGLLSLSNTHVSITSITPQQDGYVIRLYNPDNAPQETVIRWSKQPATVKAVLSGKTLDPKAPVKLPGMGVMEISVH
ncbi:MAG TPA: glycoside hydrolase family 38 C-terminal domain-containing protein [Chitinophaga sp.]|uniref:glycoside hydrolase family 38 N-terminal domain-containing protein n=1 Tax=Chitinophaga sp. TaxID=1869181 RepID=UPI002C3B6803|nr:glycoside hydrolase family 38 C-terminal domain-containing protein [Chitinophaga sp.]HVI44256.1 glycoside hydrolase family 38 C-terminal domain-containing protein [Chitinophaga sp.]